MPLRSLLRDLIMQPRVLLAWEGGAGRGHVVTLRIVAEALGDDVICDAALCRMEHAAEIEPCCDRVFPAARLWVNRERRQAAGNPHTATWGDFLGDLNFFDADFLVTQIGWWLDVIRARRSALVIADFAPCAMLAARTAGLPCVAVGTGYSTPPAGLDQYPVLLPGFDRRVHDEVELCAAVNAALDHFGAAPLARLSDIYDGAHLMPRTIAGLDPYDGLRSAPLLPPLNEALPAPGETGTEIFVYFSTTETQDEPLIRAMTGLNLPVRAFLPGATEAVRARFAAAGIAVETAPVAADLIARRTRLFVHAGQHGSLCMGLGMGLPQIAFPQHLEHLFHARRAGAIGVVGTIGQSERDEDQLRTRIHAAYADASAPGRARAAAAALRPHLFGDISAITRQRILPLLG